jgi:hypothetical protein
MLPFATQLSRKVARLRARARDHRVLAALACAFVASWVIYIGLSTSMYLRRPGSSHWDSVLSIRTPGAAALHAALAWLPVALPSYLMPRGIDPRLASAVGEYVALVIVQFALYAATWLWIGKRPPQRVLLRWIIATGLACSVVMLFSTAMPSDDPLAYGAIARLLGTYHANPYFVVTAAYPRDILLSADAWARATDAYGPAWTVLSAVLNPVVAGDPVRSVMVYRGLALAAHAANMLLIAAAIPAAGAAWRQRAVFLYAWNPLVIVEVGAGHNDVLLLTLFLVAITLVQRGHPYAGYGSLTIAALCKASAVPLLGVALLALWLPGQPASLRLRGTRLGHMPVRVAGLCGGLVLVGYGPFLWGHSPREISRAIMWQGTAQGLIRTLRAFFGRTATLLVSAPFLPRPFSRWLGHTWMALDNPTAWLVGCALMLGLAVFCLLPALRQGSGLPLVLAWMYAAWLGYLAVVNLLHTWYIVPLVGLAALAPQVRALRRFTWAITLLVELEAIFFLPLGWLQPWNLWQGLLALVLAILATLPARTWARRVAQRVRPPQVTWPALPVPAAPARGREYGEASALPTSAAAARDAV